MRLFIRIVRTGLLIIAGIYLLDIVICVGMSYWNEWRLNSKSEKIAVGMSMEDVIGIMGKPKSAHWVNPSKVRLRLMEDKPGEVIKNLHRHKRLLLYFYDYEDSQFRKIFRPPFFQKDYSGTRIFIYFDEVERRVVYISSAFFIVN